MEILYLLDDLKRLPPVNTSAVRWLEIGDFALFAEHLRHCGQKPLSPGKMGGDLRGGGPLLRLL